MSNWYSNVIFTIIALLLAAIVAKLYVPAAQLVGPQISPPTRGEMVEARKLSDPSARRARLDDLRARAPAVWVNGGDIEISGSVDVDNTVEIEGEVSIVR